MAPPSGAPQPSLSLSTGSPSPIMTFVFGGVGSGHGGPNAADLPDSTGAGLFTASGVDDAPTLGSRGPVRAIIAARDPRRRNMPACYDDATEHQLQNGGEFWTPQARSAAPVQFPQAVFTGNRAGSRDPVALGPTGHPVNLPAEGPAGSWCRPPPVPMSLSSPLVTRAFWIVVLFPTGVFIVFWLSRGLRIRAVNEP